MTWRRVLPMSKRKRRRTILHSVNASSKSPAGRFLSGTGLGVKGFDLIFIYGLWSLALSRYPLSQKRKLEHACFYPALPGIQPPPSVHSGPAPDPFRGWNGLEWLIPGWNGIANSL